MNLLLADLPAWAQVTIALAVPLNTLIGVAGVIILRRTTDRSRRNLRRARQQSRRIAELEEEVGAGRNGAVD